MSVYSPDTLSQLNSLIADANAQLQVHNNVAAMADVTTYYSLQTNIRGYATDALQVVNNVGAFGKIANQEVIDQVGAGAWNSGLNATVAVGLATADFSVIQNNPNHDIPTMSAIEQYHADVFTANGIPITAWGGASFASLGLDWGFVLNSSEMIGGHSSVYLGLSNEDIVASSERLFKAGLEALPSLSLSDTAAYLQGIGALYDVVDAFGERFQTAAGIIPAVYEIPLNNISEIGVSDGHSYVEYGNSDDPSLLKATFNSDLSGTLNFQGTNSSISFSHDGYLGVSVLSGNIPSVDLNPAADNAIATGNQQLIDLVGVQNLGYDPITNQYILKFGFGADDTPTATATINAANGTGSLTATQADGSQSAPKTFTALDGYSSAVVSAFGSSLGQILGGDDPLTRITLSTTMGPFMTELATLAANIGADFDLGDELGRFAESLPDTIKVAGAGAVAGYFFGDLVQRLGIRGELGNVVDTFGGYAVSTIATNIAMGADPITGAVPGGSHDLTNVANWELVAAQFAGSEIAKALYQPDTEEGVEGGQVLSAIDSAWTAYSVFENPLLLSNPYFFAAVVVAAILDQVLGGVIGDLFGKEHHSIISSVGFDITSSSVTPVTGHPYGGVGTIDVNNIGDGIAKTLESVLQSVNGTVTNLSSLTQFGIGFNEDASPTDTRDARGNTNGDGGLVYYYYDSAATDSVWWWARSTDLSYVTDYAIMREVSEMVFSGGDPYAQRAIDAALRSDLHPSAQTLAGYLKIAADYQFYEANKSTINALIAAHGDTKFARIWLGEIAAAAAMGFGTSVQGGIDSDALAVMTTYSSTGTPVDHNVLIGGGGNDTYIVKAGDGNVTILNGVSYQNIAKGILELDKTDLAWSWGDNPLNKGGTNLTFTQSGADLVIAMDTGFTGYSGNDPQTVTLRGWYAGSFAEVSQINLNGGDVIVNLYHIQAQTGQLRDNIDDTPQESEHIGIEGNNNFPNPNKTIGGGNGEDILVGGAGVNTFIAGGGTDVIYGGGGTDFYQLDAAGQMTIFNNESEVTGGLVSPSADQSGKLQLWAGTTWDQVSFVKYYYDLGINVAGTSTAVAVDRWFSHNDTYPNLHGYQLSSINLDDGTNIIYSSGNDFLYGSTPVLFTGIYAHVNYYIDGADPNETNALVVNYFETAADAHHATANWQFEHYVLHTDGTSEDTLVDSYVGNIKSADTLIATSDHDRLIATAGGISTLFGGLNSDTLDSGSGTGIAEYDQNGAAVLLLATSGTTTGSTAGGIASDTLIGITQVIAGGNSDTLSAGTAIAVTTLAALGNNDTLIGSTVGLSTLIAEGTNDLLESDGGTTVMIDQGGAGTAEYLLAGEKVLLAAGTSGTTTGITGDGTPTPDTLVGITEFIVGGDNSTLAAGTTTGMTLTAAGAHDTLIASLTGTTTLIGNGQSGTLQAGTGNVWAAYQLNNVTADLGTSKAKVNGTSVSDTLSVTVSGTVMTIKQVAAYGANDTLIGADTIASILSAYGTNDTLIGGDGSALTSMRGYLNGSTLEASSNPATAGRVAAVYAGGDVVISLGTTTQTATAGSLSDTLIGVHIATVSGEGSIIRGDSSADTLTANGKDETLVAGGGVGTTLKDNGSGDTLSFGGGGWVTLTGNGTDTTAVLNAANKAVSLTGTNITGISNIIATGDHDTLTGLSSGISTLTASGAGDTLIGAGGTSTLTASGQGDVLIGSGGTSTLIASGAAGTLTGSGGTSILISEADGQTLIASGGVVYARYQGQYAVVNLGVGTAKASSSATISDTLTGITRAQIYGDTATLTGGANTNSLYLYDFGSGDRVIGGAGYSQIRSHAHDDTLVASTVTGAVTELYYSDIGANVDLTAGTANVTGTGHAADTLNGFTVATIAGDNSTLKGATGTSTLTAAGTNDTLINNGAGSTLIATSTQDELVYLGGASTTIIGSGDTTLDITGANNTVTLGSSKVGGISYAIADNDSIVLIGAASGTSTLAATGASDTLEAGSGGATLMASGTGGHYQYKSGDGSETIINGAAANTTASNVLNFGAGITDESLWFVQSGNNLVIDLLGTTKSVTVKNWFANDRSKLNWISAGGLTIDSQVLSLVNAMASYAAGHPTFDPTTATAMPTTTTLQNAITASWHS